MGLPISPLLFLLKNDPQTIQQPTPGTLTPAAPAPATAQSPDMDSNTTV